MTEFLRIYLRDQFALGITWRELARRARGSNRGTELGDALTEVAQAIAEDVRTVELIMRALDVRPNRAKAAAAFAGERLGRLKRNGRLWSYSPLSRFLELEALAMGIEGKKILWTTLGDLAGLRARVPSIDFDDLMARADHQRDKLEPFRRQIGIDIMNSGHQEN
ncbi:hypothetical protein AB0383_48940 [Amycolatopsis sp. NPDC051373]|uniref:hypothetical protein n=1 Tax=Amycolatopsis sp. NPDC051373 TaxID=3155801 RepID=UPI00344C0DC0